MDDRSKDDQPKDDQPKDEQAMNETEQKAQPENTADKPADNGPIEHSTGHGGDPKPKPASSVEPQPLPDPDDGYEADTGPKTVGEPERDGMIGHDEPIRQDGMDWFVLRVASNKESSVQATLLRKIQIENMTHLVGRILVPTEKVKTIKGGKTKIKEEKLYAGYVFVEMKLEDDGRIPQDVFFLIKETTGVGDFIGTAGRPTPMAEHETEKMLRDSQAPDDEPTVRLSFEKGESVVIREGPFENYEGTVDELFPEKGQVRVLVTIFGRQAPVDLEEWMISKADED